MSRPTNANSNLLLKVIGISELADQIYCSLNYRDIACLACLSRLAFECVVPAKWEVVGVKPLLMLIPGVGIVEDDVNSAYEYILRVPKNPDLSRFNVYAPYIKHLRGTPRYTAVFPTRDNFTLGSSILPNLEHITLVSRRHYDHGDLETIFIPIDIDWVFYFLCPSLLSFEMFGVDVNQSAAYAATRFLPWMDRAACLRLVGEMSDRCPRMEVLQAFPDDSSGDFSLPYAKLAKMNHLRSFTWSGHRVDQGLMEALGTLPRLESLRFLSNIAETPHYYSDLDDSENGYDPRSDTASDPITISGGSFPALRCLELHNLGPQTIAKVCALGPLFRHLERLEVVYETYSSPYGDRTWSEDVFASLGDGSPHLSDLEISNVPSLEITKVVERLRQIPLRRLSLPSVWVTDKVGWKEFAKALPNLEELEIGAGPEFQWLRVFATELVNLRLLCLRTLKFAEMDKTAEVVSWDGQSGLYRQAITIRANFRLKFPMERQVDKVARYIYETWPNVRCEPHSTRSDSVDQKAARLLNAKLEVLRLGHI